MSSTATAGVPALSSTPKLVNGAPESSIAVASVSAPKEISRPPRQRWKKALGAVAIAVTAALSVYWFWLPIRRAWITESTDDAYVNGYVTTVAPRVSGQVSRVLVEDNNRVRKNDLLVELDDEPFRVEVAVRQAALAAAEADLVAATANVRALEATVRSQRWKVQNAVEQVQDEIASLRAAAASYRSRVASRDRAETDLRRVERLRANGAATPEQLDAYRQNARVAEAAADEALEEVGRIRAGLGLDPRPPEGTDLTEVPADLPQQFSAVRQALAELAQGVTRLGLPLAESDDTPDEVIAKFRQRDASGDIDRILQKLVPEAPEVKQAEAKVLQAKQDLSLAELDLRYCRVVAEIDGVVTRRTVNPGNTVQVGQALMAVRSLTDIWIDANFKETQLADLAIGQPAEVYADAYGREKVFRGRVTGFTYGTGSTLALLPPQNATGNFVKVVQRLPVRIELEDYDADRDALFAGLSVVPYVYVSEPPRGPDAGRKLQEVLRNGTSTESAKPLADLHVKPVAVPGTSSQDVALDRMAPSEAAR